MGAKFEFADATVDRDSMKMFQTPAPATRELRAAAETARRFGVEGEPEDRGTTLVVRDDGAAVELFLASDSLRYTRWPGRGCEIDGRRPVPDGETAVRAARDILRQLELHDGEARVSSVSEMELARASGRHEAVEVLAIAVQVNFRFELDGLPVFGPGAKMQATLISEDELLECYRFWRRTRAARTMNIIGLPDVAARLRADRAYARLPEDARVTFHQIRLGYLALPPRETQGYLVPVYECRGRVSTRALDRHDHTRYVMAVDIEPEDVKRLQLAHNVARPVL